MTAHGIDRLANGVEVMIDEAELRAAAARMGQAITRDYRDKDTVLVGVLKGCFLFLADLIRYIDLPVAVDFLGVSSYRGGKASSGEIRITQDLSKPIEGKHVLFVEDIVDTGLTMRYLLDSLRNRKPASLRVASLLDKPTMRQCEVVVDYLGFAIPNRFVVGYGLDIDERFRNLPFIGVMPGD